MSLPVIYENTLIAERFRGQDEIQDLMAQYWTFKQKTVHYLPDGMLIILPKEIGLFFGSTIYASATSLGFSTRTSSATPDTAVIDYLNYHMYYRLSTRYLSTDFISFFNIIERNITFNLALLPPSPSPLLAGVFNYTFKDDINYLHSSRIIGVSEEAKYTELVYIHNTLEEEMRRPYNSYIFDLLPLFNSPVNLLTPIRMAVANYVTEPTTLYNLNSFYVSRLHKAGFVVTTLNQLLEKTGTAYNSIGLRQTFYFNELAFYLPVFDSNYGGDTLNTIERVELAHYNADNFIIQGDQIHYKLFWPINPPSTAENDANSYENYNAITYNYIALVSVLLSIADQEFNPLVHFSLTLEVSLDDIGELVYIEDPGTKELASARFYVLSEFGNTVLSIVLDESYYFFRAQVYSIEVDPESGIKTLNITMGYYTYGNFAIYVPGIQAFKTPWLFHNGQGIEFSNTDVYIEYDEVEQTYYRAFRTSPLSGAQLINGSYKLTDMGAVPTPIRDLPVNVEGQTFTYKNIFMWNTYETRIAISDVTEDGIRTVQNTGTTQLPTYAGYYTGDQQAAKHPVFFDVDGSAIYNGVVYSDSIDNSTKVLNIIKSYIESELLGEEPTATILANITNYNHIPAIHEGELASDFNIYETAGGDTFAGYDANIAYDLKLTYTIIDSVLSVNNPTTKVINPFIQSSPPVLLPAEGVKVLSEIRLLDSDCNILGVFVFQDSTGFRKNLNMYISALYNLLANSPHDSRYESWLKEEARLVTEGQPLQEEFIPELNSEGLYKYLPPIGSVDNLTEIRYYKDLVDLYLATNVSYNSFMSIEFLANYLLLSDTTYTRIKNIMMDNSVYKLPIMTWPLE